MISLVFTVKVDAPVFFPYLRSVRTILNLRSFSNPPTTRAGLKLDGVQGKLGILGFCGQIFILQHYVNVIIVKTLWLVKMTSLVWQRRDWCCVICPSLLSSVYMCLLRGSHNSLEIEQRSEKIMGLGFFQICLHFRLRFWQRGGKFKSLIFILRIASPT